MHSPNSGPSSATPNAPRLRILILADVRNKTASTVTDHLAAFTRYSRHDVSVINVAGQEWPKDLSFDYYDVLILHYSICIIYDWFMPPNLARAVRKFSGLKIQFLQDEYRWINKIIDKGLELKIDVLYSVLFPESATVVYKILMDAGVAIRYTLTGFVSDEMTRFVSRPIKERPLDVVYRGRPVPFITGALCREKMWIGEKFLTYAKGRGLRCDIAWREEDRIYGEAWLNFNASSRVTLGTESGTFIADFESKLHDGIEAYVKEHPDCTFEEIFEAVIKPFEGNMDMTAISPRVFEAMATKTALVMFPGRYSDFLKPGKHYVVLNKDFSNFDEVVEKIKDDAFLQEMVDRNHEEFILSGAFSFKTFIEQFDSDLAHHWAIPREDKATQKTGEFASYPGNWLARNLFRHEQPAERLLASSRLIGVFYKPPKKLKVAYHRLRSLIYRMAKPLIRCAYAAAVLAAFPSASNRRLKFLVMQAMRQKDLPMSVRFKDMLAMLYIHALNSSAASSRIPSRRRISYSRGNAPGIVPAQSVTSAEDCGVDAAHDLTVRLQAGQVRRVLWERQDGSRFSRLSLASIWSYEPSSNFSHIYASDIAGHILDLAEKPYRSQEQTSKPGPSERLSMKGAASYSSGKLVSVILKVIAAFMSWVLPVTGRGPGLAGWFRLFKRRRSVVFLHNSYYHFEFLAKELRARGWDAITVSSEPGDSGQRLFFHGEDFNIHSKNALKFYLNALSLKKEITRRFSAVHFYGVNMMHWHPTEAEASPLHPVFPGSFHDLRAKGVRVGYSIVGCNDGISQTEWNKWTEGMCSKCRFQDEPGSCSDIRNLAWGYKRNMFCDLVAAEMMPRLDYTDADNVINVPFTYCVDERQWHPDISVPEKYKIERMNDEVVVMHAVGNFDARTLKNADPKGTRVIRDTIDKLRSDGLNVRLEFITGIPSGDMKYLQVQADVIIDQLFFGRYGAIAREGLMLGKPVIGYLKKDFESESDPLMREFLETCPVVNATEHTLYDVLRKLILDKAQRAEIGHQSREFALKWHSIKASADRFEGYYSERLGIN